MNYFDRSRQIPTFFFILEFFQQVKKKNVDDSKCESKRFCRALKYTYIHHLSTNEVFAPMIKLTSLYSVGADYAQNAVCV